MNNNQAPQQESLSQRAANVLAFAVGTYLLPHEAPVYMTDHSQHLDAHVVTRSQLPEVATVRPMLNIPAIRNLVIVRKVA